MQRLMGVRKGDFKSPRRSRRDQPYHPSTLARARWCALQGSNL